MPTRSMLSLFALLLVVGVFIALPVVAQVSLPNPIRCETLQCVLLGVIRIFLGLLALLATFVFIYGGFLMITSAGNAETVRKAKETLFWATIGIIVVLGSWVFIRFVIQSVTTATGA